MGLAGPVSAARRVTKCCSAAAVAKTAAAASPRAIPAITVVLTIRDHPPQASDRARTPMSA